MTGDREHGLAVELGVVKAVEQVDAAGSGRRQADAQLAGILGIGASHERRRFFMPYLYKADLLLPLAQRFHDAVDAVPGETEDDIDSPSAKAYRP